LGKNLASLVVDPSRSAVNAVAGLEAERIDLSPNRSASARACRLAIARVPDYDGGDMCTAAAKVEPGSFACNRLKMKEKLRE